MSIFGLGAVGGRCRAVSARLRWLDRRHAEETGRSSGLHCRHFTARCIMCDFNAWVGVDV